MIGYFPTPYEDELYYSIIARYHIHVGNLSRKHTNKELFGKKVNINLELPMGLAHLVSQINIFSKEFTKEYFINQHTVIPFVKPFKSEEWNEKIYKSDFKNLYIFLFSYSKYNVKNKKYLYYCAECLKEQLKSNGEGFWNRIHQIPGIFVCTRHKTPLLEYSLKISEMGFINYLIPTIEDIREPLRSYSEELMKYLIDLAEDVEYIIRMNYKSFSEEYYISKYVDLLGKKGFAYPIKKRREYLQKLIIEYYPTDFLELLDSFFKISDKFSWVPSLINIEENRSLHPIRHLLLMRLLSGSAKNYFEKENSFKPFGEGPWVCMNPFCKNYLKENIKNVNVRVNNSDRKIQGIIKCNCGFEYIIKEGEKSPFDIRDFHRRIVKRGRVWELNFNELLKQDLTLNKIAELANISRDTVIRIKNRGHLSSVQLKNKEGLMNKQKLKNGVLQRGISKNPKRKSRIFTL
ncbi:TnsD family Tn7-like transposition protein [Lysinibacillus boronitolerans]|uniref:TnsD family Tn7-like transposition protein n=1 Tax=Lysinibacillus boronitolerans TaxID=309788 RepID=UPI0002E2E648|nr:TnsD family Tn7-like transposition protein [Lysinibacillus boronitolerans]